MLFEVSRFPHEVGAYEELLTDAVEGVTFRFARQDYVEEAWRILDPVLADATPVFEYKPGSWGRRRQGDSRPKAVGPIS